MNRPTGNRQTMTDRFREHEREPPDRFTEILVVCPHCSQMAVVVPIPGTEDNRWRHRRLACKHCGHQREARHHDSRYGSAAQPVDPFFGRPLWLQRPLGDHILWACNLDHLDYIESFVRARIRERRQSEHGWSNAGLVSRLPKWLKAGGKREQVLATIETLRSSVND